MTETDYAYMKQFCGSLKLKIFDAEDEFLEIADQIKGFSLPHGTIYCLQEAREIIRSIMRFCEFSKRQHLENMKNCANNQPLKGTENANN
jgi:hypothetical protein